MTLFLRSFYFQDVFINYVIRGGLAAKEFSAPATQDRLLPP